MTIADYVKDIRSFDVSVTVVLDEITVTSEPLSFTIDPTLEHTQELLREYVSSGEVKGPLVPQLTNTLKQVKHHQENENIEQATDHLNKFIKHVNDEAMQDHINNQVKEVFIQDLKKLIEILASSQNE